MKDRELCQLNVPTYPNLVRQFFENISLGAFHIEGTVKGKLIEINEQMLSNLLNIPKEGDCYLVMKERVKTLRLILGRSNVKGVIHVHANQLSLEMRLLHNIISRIFLPRTGRFDWVSERDLVFMR